MFFYLKYYIIIKINILYFKWIMAINGSMHFNISVSTCASRSRVVTLIPYTWPHARFHVILVTHFVNKNWRDIQRKRSVHNVNGSSIRAPWQNGPYKNKHKQHKTRRTTRRNIQSEWKLLIMFCVAFFHLNWII